MLFRSDEADGGPEPAVLVTELSDALGNLPGQVVDLSANRTTLELNGARAQDVLDKSCRLDLDESAFLVFHPLSGAEGGIVKRRFVH